MYDQIEKKAVPSALLISSDLSRADTHLFFSTEYTISNKKSGMVVVTLISALLDFDNQCMVNFQTVSKSVPEN